MPIDSSIIKAVTASLYERSLKKIPDDTRAVLAVAQHQESNETARRTFTLMLESADAANRDKQLVCSDVGIPTYSVKIGTRVQFSGRCAEPRRLR